MHQLIDTHNRHIQYLRISITDRCNLRCIYCMPSEGIELIDHNDIFSYEEILRVATAAAGRGINKIRVTGGEPLVRKGVAGLLRELSGVSGISDISLTTNGILLKDFAPALRKAGMKRINISLDTLNPEKYKRITRLGDLTAVLNGISAAKTAGFDPIKINVVVMRGINDDEIVSFARLTLDRPVHIRFIEFMPFDMNVRTNADYLVSAHDMQEQIASLGPLFAVQSKDRGPAQMFKLRGAQGRVGFISPLSNHFCAACNRLRLTADGKLRACLFSDIETDIKTPLRSGCSIETLQDIMKQAVLNKPARHAFFEPSFRKCMRSMSSIGG